LNPYEKSQVKEYQIDLKPRKNYGPEMEKKLIDDYATKRSNDHTQKIEEEKQRQEFARNKLEMNMRVDEMARQKQQ
jgi:hypothetical protein